jgi:hypothetical protein
MLAELTANPPYLLTAYLNTIPSTSTFTMTTINSDQPVNAKGLRGFFARARMTSTEPSGPSSSTNSRARIRNFVRESRPSTPQKPNLPPDPAHNNRPTPSHLSRIAGSPEAVGGGARIRPPGSPGRTRRKGTIAPSTLPAIQRGDDGKWQPPSLSRGSMSTGALAVYADANGREHGMESGMTGKQILSVVFVQGESGFTTRLMEKDEMRPSRAVGSKERVELAENPSETCEVSREPCPPVIPIMQPPLQLRPRPSTIPSEASTGVYRSLSASRTCEDPRTMSSPPLPNSTSPSSPLTPLSREHYLLRLSTSFLVKSLTPIIKASSFVQNDKNVEMKRLANERLSALGKMEKNWGGEWGKAAMLGGDIRLARGASEDTGVDGGSGLGLEGRIRSMGVDEEAKERERWVWVAAIKDGILFCL